MKKLREISNSKFNHVAEWMSKIEGGYTLWVIGIAACFYIYLSVLFLLNAALINDVSKISNYGFIIGIVFVIVSIVVALKFIRGNPVYVLFGMMTPGGVAGAIYTMELHYSYGIGIALLSLGFIVLVTKMMKVVRENKKEISSDRKKINYKDLIEAKKKNGVKHNSSKKRKMKRKR